LSVGSPPSHPLKMLKKDFSIFFSNVCKEFSVNFVNVRWAVLKISRIYGTNNLFLRVVSPSTRSQFLKILFCLGELNFLQRTPCKFCFVELISNRVIAFILFVGGVSPRPPPQHFRTIFPPFLWKWFWRISCQFCDFALCLCEDIARLQPQNFVGYKINKIKRGKNNRMHCYRPTCIAIGLSLRRPKNGTDRSLFSCLYNILLHFRYIN